MERTIVQNSGSTNVSEGSEADSLVNNGNNRPYICLDITLIMWLRMIMQMFYIVIGIYLYWTNEDKCSNKVEYIPLLIAIASFLKIYNLYYDGYVSRQNRERCVNQLNSVIKFINNLFYYFFVIYFVVITFNGEGCIKLINLYTFLLWYIIIEYICALVVVVIFISLITCGLRVCFPHILIGTLQNIPFRIGASDDSIDKLSVYKYVIQNSKPTIINKNDPSDFIEIDNNSTTCAICMEDYEQECNVIYLECHHHFHKICCQEWLKINKSCALCRAPVNI